MVPASLPSFCVLPATKPSGAGADHQSAPTLGGLAAVTNGQRGVVKFDGVAVDVHIPGVILLEDHKSQPELVAGLIHAGFSGGGCPSVVVKVDAPVRVDRHHSGIVVSHPQDVIPPTNSCGHPSDCLCLSHLSVLPATSYPMAPPYTLFIALSIPLWDRGVNIMTTLFA